MSVGASGFTMKAMRGALATLWLLAVLGAGCSRHIEPEPAARKPTGVPTAAPNAQSVPFEALTRKGLGQRGP